MPSKKKIDRQIHGWLPSPVVFEDFLETLVVSLTVGLLLLRVPFKTDGSKKKPQGPYVETSPLVASCQLEHTRAANIQLSVIHDFFNT